MADTTDLADARGVASYAAGELHVLLTVYGDQIPKPVAESMAKLREALSTVTGV